MAEKPKKKKLAIILGLVAVGVVGGTLYCFQTSDTFRNIFNVAESKQPIVEHFESPDNWTPGTTMEKKVEVTNENPKPMAVRVSYTEKWQAQNGDVLSSTLESGENAAIINFNDDNTWKKVGDYYYYVGELAPGSKTTSFINGVTFNENVNLDSNSKTITKEDTDGNGINDNTTITYTISGYNNATYTLDIIVETIQADQAQNAWGVDVNALNE